MRSYIIALLIGTFLPSCTDSSEIMEDSKNHLEFNQKTGELTISTSDLVGNQVTKIVLNSDKDFRQVIHLDSNLHIMQFKNLLNSPEDKNYINTWMSFDKQGNFDYPKSYYYSTYLSYDDSLITVDCLLKSSMLNDKSYIIIGNYDNNFNLKSSQVDTILFDDNLIAKVPVKNWTIGTNTVKFIIIEETISNDTVQQKKTYVTKDFFLKDTL
ncbi:hypothetical protein [uncultured Maribacter sp.]|uniref:hypothetical protein n=1 Tax=uncultured Maribacter sp. TaxID=431308 RepID=UPI0030EEBD0D|tara:strand:- start:1085 stop:1720 length:636 start_codon:yes stop_codon:yes gene_type:complete